MAHKTLGRFGQALTWFIFILLLYCLLAAYITGGGALVLAIFKARANTLHDFLSYLPWIFGVGILIYEGTFLSDRVNRILMLGVLISFSVLGACVTPHIHLHHLLFVGHFRYLFFALPILFASFGFHIVLPTIRDYLNDHAHVLPWVVILGSLISLIVYILWEFLIFGLVPVYGPHSLSTIYEQGQLGGLLTQTILAITHNRWVSFATRSFVFFALSSSFIGVSLGLFDLLADGFHIKKTHAGRGLLSLLTFLPPFIFALFYPKGFLMALSFAGVFVAILHGILPMAMIFSGRYIKKFTSSRYRVFGGKTALVLVFVVSCAVIVSNFV